jgi:hypothetical protein
MATRAAGNDDGGMSKNISLKMHTWWRRDVLDEQLARGVDPATDVYLARRAAQLRSRSTRNQFAEALELALTEAHKTWSVSAHLPLRRLEVRECADDLIALARRLRDGRPIDVQGAAMVSRLVFDGISPMYRDGVISLRYALRSARLALDPTEVAEPEFSNVA